MKSKLILTGTMVAILMLGAYGIGCASEEPLVSHGEPVKDYVSLFDNLRAKGATVEPVGEVNQPFFSVRGFAIKVNGHDVQVFEYDEVAQADSEAQLVSLDGSSIGTIMASWIAPPHFYKAGRIIVLYVGEEDTVIGALDSVLGSQFAGR